MSNSGLFTNQSFLAFILFISLYLNIYLATKWLSKGNDDIYDENKVTLSHDDHLQCTNALEQVQQLKQTLLEYMQK